MEKEGYKIELNANDIQILAKRFYISWMFVQGKIINIDIFEIWGEQINIFSERFHQFLPQFDLFTNPDFLKFIENEMMDFEEKYIKFSEVLFFTINDWKNETQRYKDAIENALDLSEKEEIFQKKISVYWENTFLPIIKYARDYQEWFQYENGKFIKFESKNEDEIKEIVLNYYEYRDLEMSEKGWSLAKKIIKIKYGVYLRDFDKDPNILNCKNGLLYLDSKLLYPHTPNYLSLRQLPVKYLGIFPSNIPDTPLWDSLKKEFEKPIKTVEYFIKCIIFKNGKDEYALYLLGRRGSGKSTILGVVEGIIGDVCSHESLSILGTRFGLSNLVGKLANIDKDLVIGKLNPVAVSMFKKIVGRDKKITVDEKHKTPYDYNFDPFFLLHAGNLLPILPPTDRESVFRRTIIEEINRIENAKTDVTFKDRILNECDSIFTQLINEGYESKKGDNYDENKFIHNTSELWDKWADPIANIVNTLFEFNNKIQEKSDKIMYNINVDKVRRIVDDALYDWGYERNFTDRKIDEGIKKIFKRMKIEKGHSGNEYYWKCCKYKFKDFEDFDLDDNEENKIYFYRQDIKIEKDNNSIIDKFTNI